MERLAVENGSLSAEGASGNPVTFKGENELKRYWEGIEFETNNPDNLLDNVDVAHGGANSWANVFLQNGSRCTVTNSLLRLSSTYGIWTDSNTTLEASNKAFQNNEKGGIKRA
jgi:hypothetical protein